MSSEKYQNAFEKMNERQRQIMGELYMRGLNRDGHSWNTYGDIEDTVADLLEAGRPNVGMLTQDESADATILNIQNWDYEVNGKYQIDKESGMALFAEYMRLKEKNKELKRGK